MSGEISSFISKIKSNQRVKSFDEASTKQAIILPILSYLGWDIFDTDEVTPEYPVENLRVDYSLRINNVNRAFIEVKKVGEDLEREHHQEQLLEYSFRQGIELAVLTNGITWWFYLPTEKGHWHERKFYTIDFYQQDPDDVESKLREILLKENVKSGSAIANAHSIYSGKQKQKVVAKTLPEAWNKLLTEPSLALIELIAEASEKLCGFKPEQLEVREFLETQSEEWLITEPDIPSVSQCVRQLKPIN